MKVITERRRCSSAQSQAAPSAQRKCRVPEPRAACQKIQPDRVPRVDNVKIIVGTYNGARSLLSTPYNMTYLDVEPEEDESFVFHTPDRQTTGFIFPRRGHLNLYNNDLPLNNLTILKNNEGGIHIAAQADSKFVLITAEPYDFPIVTNGVSIHTTGEALERSLERIQTLQKKS